jgi:hypothetical protein
MMTQTHLLIASGLFIRAGQPKRNMAVIAGALAPDVVIYVLFVYAVITGIPQSTLWNETYWAESWQAWVAVGNSAPLYGGLLLTSLLVAAPKDGRARWESLPALFALAALTHLAADLPLHNDDAHSHFWPVSDWRFQSPFSYWDRDHHAGVLAPLELLLGFGLLTLLFRRFKRRGTRILLSVAGIAYLALIVTFIFAT